MRLIDANKIYDAVERRYQVSSGIEHRRERDLLELICLSETVDAAPVKHGKWIEREDIPALGVPGATTFKQDWSQDCACICTLNRTTAGRHSALIC